MRFTPPGLAVTSLAFAACTANPSVDQYSAAVEDPVLAARLHVLADELEEKRQELHIPGMAVAVVKDDAIVFARGFGMADVENEEPVTPETIFAIGSSTKAFTATVIGMLADEGKIDWDDPVSRHLPYLTLDIDTDDEDAQVVIRDLLAHRTGFTRMGVLWAGGQTTREEVLRTAAGAEPWAGFREGFHYNNVMYLAAGQAAGVAAESDWDSLIDERIFEPLGMDDSTTSVLDALKDERLALGYRWNEESEEFEHLPMRNLDNCAPAGSINSNVLDMAEWIRFQLGEGVYGGERLISLEKLDDTRERQIEMGPDFAYGLGWMLNKWEGRDVVEHGGNIDGFAAQVGLLPEEELGYVLLANVTATPLQRGSLALVFETLLREEDPPAPVEAAAPKPAGFDGLVGDYVANFAHFKEATFKVSVTEGKLAVDVPGQMNFTLKEPDEEGKRYFELTNEIAVSFLVGDDGLADVLVMHQHGYDFECPREGYEYPIEVPLEELEKYLGKYRDDTLGEDVEILIQNNHLAVDIPSQMVVELRPPDEEGFWAARMSGDKGLVFKEEDGRVVAVTAVDGEVRYDCPRLDPEDVVVLPTIEEIHALRKSDERRKALAALGTFRMSGPIRFAQSGVEGTGVATVAANDRFDLRIDVGKFGQSRTSHCNGRCWAQSAFEPFDELTGDRLVQARLGHPMALIADWREFFEEEKVLRADTLDERSVYLVELKTGDVPPTTAYVDAETGDVVRADSTLLLPDGMGRLPMKTTSSGFREVHGLRMPAESIVSNPSFGRLIAAYDTLETGVELPADYFVMVPPE